MNILKNLFLIKMIPTKLCSICRDAFFILWGKSTLQRYLRFVIFWQPRQSGSSPFFTQFFNTRTRYSY